MMRSRLLTLLVLLIGLPMPSAALSAPDVTYFKVSSKIDNVDNDLHVYRVNKGVITEREDAPPDAAEYPDNFVLGQLSNNLKWWAVAQVSTKSGSRCVLISPGDFGASDNSSGYGYRELLGQPFFAQNALLKRSGDWAGETQENVESTLKKSLSLSYRKGTIDEKARGPFSTRAELVEELFPDCQKIHIDNLAEALRSGTTPTTLQPDSPEQSAKVASQNGPPEPNPPNVSTSGGNTSEQTKATIADPKGAVNEKAEQVRKLEDEVVSLHDENAKLKKQVEQLNFQVRADKEKSYPRPESNQSPKEKLELKGITVSTLSLALVFALGGILLLFFIAMLEWLFSKRIRTILKEHTDSVRARIEKIQSDQYAIRSRQHDSHRRASEMSDEQRNLLVQMESGIDKISSNSIYLKQLFESVEHIEQSLKSQPDDKRQRMAKRLLSEFKSNSLTKLEEIGQIKNELFRMNQQGSLDLAFFSGGMNQVLKALDYFTRLLAHNAVFLNRVDEALRTINDEQARQRSQSESRYALLESQQKERDDRIAKLEKKVAGKRQALKEFSVYLVRDLKASGYLKSDFAYTPGDNLSVQTLRSAMQTALEGAEQKPELQNYVRNLIHLRQHLQRSTVTDTDYFRPSGLPKVSNALAEKTFFNFYTSNNPEEALKGQWGGFVQHVFRAALLLQTYWRAEVDPALLARLQEVQASARLALLAYGLVPHELELLVDRDWLDQRRGWIESSREVNDDLLNAGPFRTCVAPLAAKAPVYCDVVTWGLDSNSEGTVTKSILAERQPSDHW